MNTKRLTIRDIAKITGVSYATVSRALSGSAGISHKTRTQIKEVCERLGYTTNYTARSLAVRKSRLIGFILGKLDDPYMSQLACEAEIYARQRDYTLILCNSMHREQHEAELFSMLIGRQVDGIIIIPANTGSFAALEKYMGQVPTVVIGDNLRGSPNSYVAVDNYQGTVMGSEYLISLGHRSIVYLGCRTGSMTHELRRKGYMDTCKKYHIKPAVIINRGSSSSIEQGYALARELFAGPCPYTAIFAASDTTALGVMKAADEAGIAIPRDISLIGFDNIAYSVLSRINLTTIEQPFTSIASSAVDTLIRTIEDPAFGYSYSILAPTLVKRGTCQNLTRKETA
jgi:LacI family transcriptional regulator